MKRAIILIGAVVLIFTCLYLYNLHNNPNTQKILKRQGDTLVSIRNDLDTIKQGTPQLENATRKIKEELSNTRDKYFSYSKLLQRKDFLDIGNAYLLSSRDMEVLLQHLSTYKMVLDYEFSVLDLLEENKNLLFANSGDTIKIHNNLMKIKKDFSISEELIRVTQSSILTQETQWLNLQQKVENLKQVAQGDEELKKKFKSFSALLEQSGVGINNIMNYGNLLEALLQKQKIEYQTQVTLVNLDE